MRFLFKLLILIAVLALVYSILADVTNGLSTFDFKEMAQNAVPVWDKIKGVFGLA